jgi:ABC-type phosphate/phosphonate transport system substrate-binding protein
MKSAKQLSIVSCLVCISLILLFSTYAHADFKIGIMQDKKGSAAKFRPLINYFAKNGINVSFVAARNYPHAAKMFSNRKIDGMFSGSGVAGCMIIKGLASPVVRPVNSEGWSTYWAVVLAPKGAARFTQNANYFQNKKVIFCSLASSGEFFYHSILNNEKINTTIMKASSHGAAIDALFRKVADIAIVKNRVWEKMKAAYPTIQRVGEDPGENPNGTFIVSKKTDLELVKKVTSIMLALEEDTSTEAKSVKEQLRISSYIKTDIDDFQSTIELLEKAGVDKSFDFKL